MKASINALIALAAIIALAGCAAFTTVQERTLTNGSGGSITCKQTGSGLITGPAAKARFDSCVQDATAQGFN